MYQLGCILDPYNLHPSTYADHACDAMFGVTVLDCSV